MGSTLNLKNGNGNDKLRENKKTSKSQVTTDYNRYDSRAPQNTANSVGWKSSVELLNGRLAILGLGIGIATEKFTGLSIWEQVNISSRTEQEVLVGVGLLCLVATVLIRANLLKEQMFIR